VVKRQKREGCDKRNPAFPAFAIQSVALFLPNVAYPVKKGMHKSVATDHQEEKQLTTTHIKETDHI
jgi:hypothetical protein